MKQTWRWFGPADKVTLSEVRQAGASGIVTALMDIRPGDVWPQAAIAERRALIEGAGLTWEVVESLPVSEAILPAPLRPNPISPIGSGRWKDWLPKASA